MGLFRRFSSAWFAAQVAIAAVATLEAGAQASGAPAPPTTPGGCGPGTISPVDPGKHSPSYMEDSFSRLKSAAPALRGLKFEAHLATVEQPDESADILSQTGEVIQGLLPRVPNLIAKEELSQAFLPLPYAVNDAQQTSGGVGRRGASPVYTNSARTVEGEELYKMVRTDLETPKNRVAFTFRIQSSPDPTYGAVLSESRINARNEPVDVSATGSGSPRGVGFGSSWLIFEPDSLRELHFRYLGHQKLDKRETVVVAFAQVPEQVSFPSQIAFGDGFCPYYMQGLVWIDPNIFQIVRMQTDLLAPLPYNQTTRLRSEIHFSEIHIPERNLTLWMPRDVEISWQTKDQFGAELHRYSNYRLFGATSRVVLPDPDATSPLEP